MELEQIKMEVDRGRAVHYKRHGRVISGGLEGEYLIVSLKEIKWIDLKLAFEMKTVNADDFHLEKIRRVNNLADVQNLFRDICELGVAFHEDDDLSDYIQLKDDSVALPRKEALRINTLLNEASVICDKFGVDIYEIAYAVYKEYN